MNTSSCYLQEQSKAFMEILGRRKVNKEKVNRLSSRVFLHVYPIKENDLRNCIFYDVINISNAEYSGPVFIFFNQYTNAYVDVILEGGSLYITTPYGLNNEKEYAEDVPKIYLLEATGDEAI